MEVNNITMFLRYAYTIFVGILIATFIGVGIAAFYPKPKMPVYPMMNHVAPAPGQQTDMQLAEEQRQQEVYSQQAEEFRTKNIEYTKYVSSIALAAAVIIVAISLVFRRQILFLADGLLLGGVLTLIYSIVRGFEAQDDKFRFLVVTVGLIVALALGYLKFIKTHEQTTISS